MAEDQDRICVTPEQFEILIEKAAAKGARAALREVGLDDAEAVNDIKDLRELMSVVRTASQTALQTAVRCITIGVLALIFLGGIYKIKGGQ